MQTPNANIFDSNLGGLDGNTSIYADRNWKTFIGADWNATSTNPLHKLMLIINVLLTGSYLDQWKMIVHTYMHFTRNNCPVCKTMQRKSKRKHLVAHCPKCHKPCHTNGTTKNGTIKFTCNNKKVHAKPKHFNINTCQERLHFRWLCSIRALELLGHGNSLKGIRELTGVTRHFLDLVVSAASKETQEKGILRKKIKQDFLAVYIDGTYVLRGCTLVAKVGDQIFWRCTTAEDSETIRNLLLELKEVVSVTNLIFVTDGLVNYVKPIIELFPEAIHVRHFHNTWEDILIHFGHEGERYSLHVKSDVLLPSGNKLITLWKGIKYFLNRKSGKKQKQEKDPLKELMVTQDQIYASLKWNGKLMQRFSIWMNRVSDAIIDGKLPEKTEQAVKDVIHPEKMPLKFRKLVRLRIKEFEFRIRNREKKNHFHSKTERVERLAKGDVSEVVNKFPFVGDVLDTLKKEFAGKHITSNPVEGVHSIFQPYLHMHRTLKGNSRLMELILHILYSGRSLEEILPFEAYLSAEISRVSGERMLSGRRYLMRYSDKYRNSTERLVDVIETEKGYIWAFCHLRNEVRKFKKSRIEFFKERVVEMALLCDTDSCKVYAKA